MATFVFIEDADLFNRIGGRAAFTQLLDPQGRGIWNATMSLLVRTDACNLVIEAAGVQVELGGMTVEQFRARYPNLVTYASLKGLVLAWLYGSGGQAVPEKLAAFDVQVETGLERLAARRRKHGAVDFDPQPAQEVRGSIDMDPDGVRMGLASWKTGFC